MNPDHFQQAWQAQASQTRLTIDAELLLKEVRRNQQNFTALLIWRDLREVGLSLVMVPLWFYLGVKFSLPWTWYCVVPALVWMAGFMLADRMRQRRQPPQPGEPLRQRVESSLAQVEHQIWLLRNVHWWAILPFALSVVPFLAQIVWSDRGGGWLARTLVMTQVAAVIAITLAAVYWLNQIAVRTELVPRRQELEALLASLKDETPAAS